MGRLAFTATGLKSTVAQTVNEVIKYCEHHSLKLEVFGIRDGFFGTTKRIVVNGDDEAVAFLAQQINERI